MKNIEVEMNAHRCMDSVAVSLVAALLAGAFVLFAAGTGFGQVDGSVRSSKPVNRSAAKTESDPAKGSSDATGSVNAAPVGTKLITPTAGSVDLVILPGELFASEAIYTVPAGKRLVIEYVTAKMRLGSIGAVPDGTVTIYGGVGSTYLQLALMPKDPSFRILAFSGMTKMYVNPGQNVTVIFDLNYQEATASNYAYLRFSGYLEDI